MRLSHARLATLAAVAAMALGSLALAQTPIVQVVSAVTQFKAVFGIGISSASIPVVTGCGTSPTLAAGSGDLAGEVTTGTGAGGCILTFGTAKTIAPACIVGNANTTGSVPPANTSTTALHMNNAAASTKYSYACFDKAGN